MQTLINENYFQISIIVAALALLLLYLILKILQKNSSIDSVNKPSIDINPPKNRQKDIDPADRKKRELVPHDKISKDDFDLFKNIKILIAEDDIINQKVITSLLSNSGINITIANNGEEVLDILEKNNDFSILFMDANMPIMDGYKTTAAIRKNPNYDHIPIVALSGSIAADDIKNMLNTGMEAHLEKPLNMDALYDTLYTYTTEIQTRNTPSKSKSTTLEFDNNRGLEVCGGDKEFYFEVLNDFVSNYSNSAYKLKEHINNANKIDADKMLLDISGISANIGANSLCTIALDLKESISNPTEDLEYIDNLKNYSRSLRQVCEAIEKYKANN